MVIWDHILMYQMGNVVHNIFECIGEKMNYFVAVYEFHGENCTMCKFGGEKLHNVY